MTRAQLISHAIAVLYLNRQIGKGRFWVSVSLSSGHLGDCCDALRDGLAKQRLIGRGHGLISQFKLTPSGLKLSNELIATANEVM
jgi:hypothetical protein